MVRRGRSLIVIEGGIKALRAAVPLSQRMINLYGCPKLRKSDERA